jgi:long-subunit acyl-CoA synthetase (AMP-forming)
VRDELGAVLAHDYGMTEVPMVAVASPDDPGEILAQTDGRPIPANQVRLAGRARRGRRDRGYRAWRLPRLHQSRGNRRGVHRGRLVPHRRPRAAVPERPS